MGERSEKRGERIRWIESTWIILIVDMRFNYLNLAVHFAVLLYRYVNVSTYNYRYIIVRDAIVLKKSDC
jgi:hypothetical protein